MSEDTRERPGTWRRAACFWLGHRNVGVHDFWTGEKGVACLRCWSVAYVVDHWTNDAPKEER